MNVFDKESREIAEGQSLVKALSEEEINELVTAPVLVSGLTKGSARRAYAKKYALGQVVVNIDPGKIDYRSKEIFVTSIRWPHGGGYILYHPERKAFHTTTNIMAVKN